MLAIYLQQKTFWYRQKRNLQNPGAKDLPENRNIETSFYRIAAI